MSSFKYLTEKTGLLLFIAGMYLYPRYAIGLYFWIAVAALVIGMIMFVFVDGRPNEPVK